MNLVAARRMLVLALATVVGCSASVAHAQSVYGRTARIENDTYAITYTGYAYAYYAFHYNQRDPNLAQGYIYANWAFGYADYLWNTAYYGYFDGSVSWPAYQANWRAQMTYSYYAAAYELEAVKSTGSELPYYGYAYLYYGYLYSYYTSFERPPYEPRLTPEFAKLLLLHNSDREALGFNPLTVDRKLMRIAQDHADWMLANATESQFGANGETVEDRATGVNYAYTKIAQNVLYGYDTEEEVFDVWFNRDTGEQNNIRDLKWDHVGFGVAGVGDDRYWCAVYATKRN